MKAKSLVAAGLVVVSLAGAEALRAGATGTSNANTRGVVAFVGDSNITFNGDRLVLDTTFGKTVIDSSHINDNYVPAFVTRVGSTIRTEDCLVSAGCATRDFWKLKLSGVFAKLRPDAVVTDLGVNDTVQLGKSTGVGYADYDAKIDYFMKLMPAGKPIFWTNLPCQIEQPIHAVGCAAVDAALKAAPKRWPNLTVLDWATLANSHPEYIEKGGIHYTPVGYGVWTQVVMQALDAKFPENP